MITLAGLLKFLLFIVGAFFIPLMIGWLQDFCRAETYSGDAYLLQLTETEKDDKSNIITFKNGMPLIARKIKDYPPSIQKLLKKRDSLFACNFVKPSEFREKIPMPASKLKITIPSSGKVGIVDVIVGGWLCDKNGRILYYENPEDIPVHMIYNLYKAPIGVLNFERIPDSTIKDENSELCRIPSA